MRMARKFRWWGFYALIPLMIGLIALDDKTPMSETWHLIVLVVIAAATCGLALAWIERNPRLVETDGIDGTCSYHILLDTADGLCAETVTQGIRATQEKAPAAERAADVHSPASQTMIRNGREPRNP